MEELLRLLKEYNDLTKKTHVLVIGQSQGVSLIILDPHTLDISFYKYLGSLETKHNEPARTLEGFIKATQISTEKKAEGIKALWGED